MTSYPNSRSSLFHFTEMESFMNPQRGVERKYKGEKTPEELLGFVEPENIDEWPSVNLVILRGTTWVIEAKSNQYIATIHFDPAAHEAGHYTIRRVGKPLEEGRILKIREVPEDIADLKYKMLSSFPHRYAIKTVRTQRPYIELAWRIAFTNYKIGETPD